MATTEQIVTMPIEHPETGKRMRGFRFAGKYDRLQGGKLDDWKGVADPARFIAQRGISFQAELYALALKHKGIEVREIEYRLITRPTIKLCSKDTDADAYRQRCLDWILADPAKMVSHTLILASGRLKQAQWYLWNCCQRLRECRKHSRWLPNSKACYAWERECPYLSLCECVAAEGDELWVIEEGYHVLPGPHSELGDAGFDDRIVTHSSLETLTLCDVRYYWRYPCKYRKGSEQSDALRIGSAMHAGIATYAEGGEEAAIQAINEWEEANPVLGEQNGQRRDQEVARATAMVMAAAIKWPFEE